MPRLVVREFIKRHEWLRELWLGDSLRRLFAELPAHQQWELHDCYRPADDLTDDELTEHFSAIKQQHPHLSVLAGHHYGAIQNAYVEHEAKLAESPKRSGKGKAEVHFIVRPHVDAERLAAALELIDASIDKDALK